MTNRLSCSSTDPDAQMFRKPGRPALLSHKVQMVVDGGREGIITAVEARPSCEADSHVVTQMLARHEMAVGRPVREIVGDRGYAREATFKACLERAVHPTFAIRSLGNHAGGFTRDAFTYVAERDLYICPQGKELLHFTDNFGERQAIYRPRSGTCSGCPLKPQCAPGRFDRRVIRRWDADLWEELGGYLQSRRARQLLYRRKMVSERAFADAKEKHGLDRAQYRSRAKVQIQVP